MPITGSPDFSNLRLQQLFGALQSLQQPQSPPSGVNMEAANVPPDDAAMQSLINYKPDREASDAFMKHISSMPKREDYQPSKLRQVVAALAGLGAGVHPAGISGGQPIGFVGDPAKGIETAEMMRNLPYSRALGDWELKNKPLEMAATNEKNYNVNNRQVLLGAAARETADKRADTYADRVRLIEDENRSKDEKRQADAKRDQDRLAVYRSSALGGVLQTDETTGLSYMVHKDGTKSPIDMDLFSPKEKEELQQRNRVALEGVKEKNKEKFESVLQPNRLELKKTPSGGVNAAAKPETGNELVRRRLNSANQFRIQHPELAKWVTITGNNIKVTPPAAPSKFGQPKGPSEQEYDMIQSAIMGSRESKGDIQLPSSGKPGTKGTQNYDNIKVEPGRVIVTDMDGKPLGTIDQREAGQLDKSKYRIRVQ